jgi:hypothetical protein
VPGVAHVRPEEGDVPSATRHVLQTLTEPGGGLGGRTHRLGGCDERRRPCSAGLRLSHRPQERLDRVGASALATDWDSSKTISRGSRPNLSASVNRAALPLK